MKKILSLVFMLALMGISVSTFAQEEIISPTRTYTAGPDNDTDEVFRTVEVEVMPDFIDGDAARIKYLSENIEYPRDAKENGKQGTVYIDFVVEKDGSISNAAVFRSVDKSLDAEALRVIQNMPKWSPGMQNGEPVRTLFEIPLKFTIDNSNYFTPPSRKKKKKK
jgi:protein TonB